MSSHDRIKELVRYELGFASSAFPLQANEVQVWKLARDHKVATILAPKILELNSPKNLVDEARYVWQLTALRSEYYIQKCGEIVNLLKAEGVVSHPLKGIPLAQKAYPKKGFRAFRDIDLLVSVDQVEKADQVLRGDGFQEIVPETPLKKAVRVKGSALEATLAGIEGLSYQKGEIYLELHTKMVPYLLGEYQIENFSPEDFLCQLFFHTTRHHFLYGLRHLIDIALWTPHVRSMGVVEAKLRENDLLWLSFPAWKLASELFPENVVPPPQVENQNVIRYTDQIRKHLAEMPYRAIPLAGSPIPFVRMKKRVIRSIQSSDAMMKYQIGSNGRWERFMWRIKRPVSLVWRHAPVLWQLLKLRLI